MVLEEVDLVDSFDDPVSLEAEAALCSPDVIFDVPVDREVLPAAECSPAAFSFFIMSCFFFSSISFLLAAMASFFCCSRACFSSSFFFLSASCCSFSLLALSIFSARAAFVAAELAVFVAPLVPLEAGLLVPVPVTPEES